LQLTLPSQVAWLGTVNTFFPSRCCILEVVVHEGPATAQTGNVKEEREVHGGQINDIRFSADGTHFVTASADMTAKLIDTLTLEV
jgi:NifU-like protein involved in Fe-S cluster formation